jgi:glycosyltransferase involved in cell wall biosynthesis
MRKRKKLLFVQLQSDLYGSSRSLLRLVGALDKGMYEPIVVVSDDGPGRRMLETAGARVIVIPNVGAVGRWNLLSWRCILIPAHFLSATRNLLRIIRREGIDLVHSNTSIILAAALAAKLAGVPHVFHIREIYDEFPLLWRLHRRFILWTSREVVCISTAVARQFPARRAVIIHNGLNFEAECPVPPARGGADAGPGAGGPLLVGCIGRIKWRRKGQEVLIRALALLKDRGVPMKALIVGSPFAGNELHLQRMTSLAQRLGVDDRVSFLDEQPDVWPLYARMDIFVLPSVLPEPLGNVILEAMAMGLPVIASRCGGTTDMIQDGSSGLLFKPGDSVELADKLASLHSDPQRRREIGEAGRRRQREEFSLRRCAGRIDAVYRRILKIPADEQRGQA